MIGTTCNACRASSNRTSPERQRGPWLPATDTSGLLRVHATADELARVQYARLNSWELRLHRVVLVHRSGGPPSVLRPPGPRPPGPPRPPKPPGPPPPGPRCPGPARPPRPKLPAIFLSWFICSCVRICPSLVSISFCSSSTCFSVQPLTSTSAGQTPAEPGRVEQHHRNRLGFGRQDLRDRQGQDRRTCRVHLPGRIPRLVDLPQSSTGIANVPAWFAVAVHTFPQHAPQLSTTKALALQGKTTRISERPGVRNMRSSLHVTQEYCPASLCSIDIDAKQSGMRRTLWADAAARPFRRSNWLGPQPVYRRR
jgi:hypothetical protein